MGSQMSTDTAGYYDVHITMDAQEFTYRIYARSDYAAAREVRKLTGVMPRAGEVQAFIPPAFHATHTAAAILH